MKEKFTHFIKVITGKYYKEKIEELNKVINDLNDIINGFNLERACLMADNDELTKGLDNVIQSYEKKIKDLCAESEKTLDCVIKERNSFEKRYEKKKEDRKAIAKELRQANKTIKKLTEEKEQLEKQVEFLKSHKRAPSLEEIKTYASGRKHTKAEGK